MPEGARDQAVLKRPRRELVKPAGSGRTSHRGAGLLVVPASDHGCRDPPCRRDPPGRDRCRRVAKLPGQQRTRRSGSKSSVLKLGAPPTARGAHHLPPVRAWFERRASQQRRCRVGCRQVEARLAYSCVIRRRGRNRLKNPLSSWSQTSSCSVGTSYESSQPLRRAARVTASCR